MAAPDSARDHLHGLLGVRRVRNGPVIFAVAPDLTVQPGDIVVLQLVGLDASSPSPQPSPTRGEGAPAVPSPAHREEAKLTPSPLEGEGWGGGEETLATVVIGSGQIIEDAVGVRPTARVVRLASEAELAGFDPTGARSQGVEHARDAGMPEGWDAWLSPMGAEPAVRTAGMDASLPTAGEFIQRLFPNPPSQRRMGGTPSPQPSPRGRGGRPSPP